MSDTDPNQYNEFDAPIPGQSLANDKEMGSYPWENPPDFADPNDYYEFAVSKLFQDQENLSNVVKLLEMEIPVNTVVEGIVMNSFMMGQITPQVAIIVTQPLIEAVMLIAQEAGVQPIISDPSVSRTEDSQIVQVLAEIAAESGQAPEAMDMMAGEEDMEGRPSGMMAPPPDDEMLMMDSGEEAMMPMEDASLPMAPEEEEEEILFEEV